MHKIYKLIVQILILSPLAFFAFFTSCYEPIEGCLEINGSNYEVSADRACDSCCVYPSLVLSVKHSFNGDLVQSGDTLVNKDGSTIILNDLRYFLSDVYLSSSESMYNVVDTVNSDCGTSDSSFEIPNDQVYILGNNSSYTVGFWNVNDSYTNLNLKFGLSDCVHDAGINNLDSDSKLESRDSLYTDGLGYNFAQLTLNDSLLFTFQGKSETVDVTKELDLGHLLGANIIVPIKFNLSILFQDIDFEVDDQNTIKSKLQARIQDAILIEE